MTLCYMLLFCQKTWNSVEKLFHTQSSVIFILKDVYACNMSTVSVNNIMIN